MGVSENMIPLTLMQNAVIFSEVSGHHLPVWCIDICIYIYIYLFISYCSTTNSPWIPCCWWWLFMLDAYVQRMYVCMFVSVCLPVCLSVCLSVCVQTHPNIILLATYLTNMQMTSHSYPICMYIGCTRNNMLFLYDIPILCHTIGIPIYISQWYSLEYPTMYIIVYIYIYIDPYIVINRISTINHPFWGFPMYGNLHI